MQLEVTAVEQDLLAGLPVARGGTGGTSLTANRVLLGNGTSAVAVAGAGTSGQVLTSNGASAPTFQDATAVFAKDVVQGRLTLTTAVPVTTADVTAAGTLYFALYKGNQIGLYTGSAWSLLTFTELSIAVPAAANQVYDVFVDYNAGTPILALTAWTNDTTRATALTTQDGVLVKTGSTGQRYVGTVRTVTASQLNDSYALRHVWNYYNRVERPMRVLEATNSWTYTTATFRQANGATANQLDFVVGVAEDAVEAHVQVGWNQTNASIYAAVGIGLDSTSAVASGCLFNEQSQAVGGYFQSLAASYRTIPAVGRHTLVWLEWSTAGTGTTTWYGDTGGTIAVQSGIHGVMRG